MEYTDNEEEVDFIKRKYRRHLFQIFFTFFILIIFITFDIICLNKEDRSIQELYFIFELLFCLSITGQAFLEVRYYYLVRHNKFRLLYTTVVSGSMLYFFVFLSIGSYIANIPLQIIFVYLGIHQEEQEEEHSCRYFDISEKSWQYVIATAFICLQTVMIVIPVQIFRTLKILKYQQNQLLDIIPTQQRTSQDFDILAKSGEFQPFQSQTALKLQQKYYNVNKAQLKNTKCMICTSRIWRSTKITRLSCNHIFHKQCFLRYYKTSNNRSSFILKCQVCGQVADPNNIQSLLLVEDDQEKKN